MGQLNSTKIHRVPVSMLWDNATPVKRNSKEKITNFLISNKVLNKLYNYVLSPILFFWIFSNKAFFFKSLKKRNIFKKNKKILFLSKNANKGTNKVIPGITRTYRIKEKIFYLHGFLGFSFEKTKKFTQKGLKLKNKKKKVKSFKKFFVKRKSVFAKRCVFVLRNLSKKKVNYKPSFRIFSF